MRRPVKKDLPPTFQSTPHPVRTYTGGKGKVCVSYVYLVPGSRLTSILEVSGMVSNLVSGTERDLSDLFNRIPLEN